MILFKLQSVSKKSVLLVLSLMSLSLSLYSKSPIETGIRLPSSDDSKLYFYISSSDDYDINPIPDEIKVDGLQFYKKHEGSGRNINSFSYTFYPLRTGIFTIPSIEIQTKQGIVKTDPITITIQSLPSDKNEVESQSTTDPELKIKGLYIGMDIHSLPAWFHENFSQTHLNYKIFDNPDSDHKTCFIIVKKELLEEKLLQKLTALTLPNGLKRVQTSGFDFKRFLDNLEGFDLYQDTWNVFIVADASGKVIDITIKTSAVVDLFKPYGMNATEFKKLFMQSYKIPTLPYITHDGAKIGVGNNITVNLFDSDKNIDIHMIRVLNKNEIKSNFN